MYKIVLCANCCDEFWHETCKTKLYMTNTYVFPKLEVSKISLMEPLIKCVEDFGQIGDMEVV